jgi:hypothetical protein
MLWIVVFVVKGTFRTIPTVESYGAGVFCSCQNPYIVAVKLFKGGVLFFIIHFSPNNNYWSIFPYLICVCVKQSQICGIKKHKRRRWRELGCVAAAGVAAAAMVVAEEVANAKQAV